MEFEKLENIYNLLCKIRKKDSSLYKNGIDITEYSDDYHHIIKLLLEEILTKEGIDWLEWFLYEKDAISGNPREDMKAWDENKNEICKDLESLHSYLVSNSYYKNNS